MPTVKELVEKRKEFEANIIAKSLEDEAFRQKLLTDPKAAIAEVTGQTIPPEVTIKVIEEAPNTVTFVVPQRAPDVSADEELSDEALEKLAGGAVVSAVVKAAAQVLI